MRTREEIEKEIINCMASYQEEKGFWDRIFPYNYALAKIKQLNMLHQSTQTELLLNIRDLLALPKDK